MSQTATQSQPQQNKGIRLVQTNNKDPLQKQQQPPQQQQKQETQQQQQEKPKEKVKKPGLVDQMWQALVLPPNKLTYNISDLGPPVFIVANTQAKREDFQITNNRGQKMECSYFEPLSCRDKPHPVVIYLHGNSSSRLEGLSLLPFLLPIGVAVILMDFAGCGLSEGSYISLGYFEKHDAQLVIDHIKKTKNICSIGIWGRSMGAATSLMLGTTRDDIEFIVADSAFVDIQILCREVAKKQYKLPNFIAKAAWSYIRKKIKQKVEFDINECNTIEYVKNPKHMPAVLFMSAKDDQLIHFSHSQRLFEAYQGNKNILLFEGNHNSRRPKYIQVEVQQYFKNNMTFHKESGIQRQLIPTRQNSKNDGDEIVCQNPLHFFQKEQESYQKEINWIEFQKNNEGNPTINSQNKFKDLNFQQPQQINQKLSTETISEPHISMDDDDLDQQQQQLKNQLEVEEKQIQLNQQQQYNNQTSQQDLNLDKQQEQEQKSQKTTNNILQETIEIQSQQQNIEQQHPTSYHTQQE